MRASLRVFLCWFWQQSFFEILLRFVRSGKLLKCHHNRPKLRYRQLRIISIHCANMLRLDLTLCVMGIWDDYGRLRCINSQALEEAAKLFHPLFPPETKKKVIAIRAKKISFFQLKCDVQREAHSVKWKAFIFLRKRLKFVNLQCDLENVSRSHIETHTRFDTKSWEI